MKNRRDFYKYNVVLAVIVFFTILMHIDNSSNAPTYNYAKTDVSIKPDFSPERYLASTQKARQAIYITLSAQKSDSFNSYQVKAFVESMDLQNHNLNYRWILAPEQQVVAGSLAGTFNPSEKDSLSIKVKLKDASHSSRIRLEVYTGLNGIKVGNVKSTDLLKAPTETQVAAQQQEAQSKIQSQSLKTKQEIIHEALTSKPSLKIMQ